MKDKILIALKNKYANLGLGQKAFEGVAEYLAATVTEEANIDNAIAGVEQVLKAFQGDSDKVRKENSTLKTQLEAATKKPDQVGDDPNKKEGQEKTQGDIPTWAKTMMEQNSKLRIEVNDLKSGKVTDTRKTALESKLSGTNEKFKETIIKAFGRMKFESDEEYDAYLTDIETDAKEFAQQDTVTSASAFGSPMRSNTGDSKEASKEEIEAVLSNIL